MRFFPSLVLTLAVSGGLAACGGGGGAAPSGPAPTPRGSVSAQALSFTQTDVGSSSTAQTLTLTNSGTGPWVGTLTITGTNASDFTPTSTCGSSLAAGASCTISVTFTPAGVGTRSATLTFTGAGLTGVALTGTGAGAVAALNVASADYGTVSLNPATAPTKTMQLSNTGNVTLNIASIAVSGTNASDFTLAGTCGSTLAAGANCAVTVAFAPPAVGVRTASLVLTDNSAGAGTQTVSLQGVGSQGIDAVIPNLGPVAGGTIVSMTPSAGLLFQPGATVTVGGASATGVSISSDGKLMQATMPAGAAGSAALTVTNPDHTVLSSAFTYTAEVAGCGADCGNVGDPYAGNGPPANQQPITACNTNINAAGNYIVTQNIGTDATANCLKVNFPGGPVNLDLGGHTVTGYVSVQSNQHPNYVENGTINCNVDSGVCLDWGVASGRIHHLTVANASLKPLANINITGIATATQTAPILQIDHITSTVMPAPNRSRTRNIMDDGTNGSNPSYVSVPVEVNNNLITCTNGASSCQGVETYDAPNSYVHNNKFVLSTACPVAPTPSDNAPCGDPARAIIFDTGSNYTVAAFNDLVLNTANRGVRVRVSQHVAVYGNLFENVLGDGRQAAVDVGENDGTLDDDFVDVYNNTFQLGQDGNAVVSTIAADVYVFDNTVTCVGNDCSQAGVLAKADIDTLIGIQAGTTIAASNNDVSALDAAGRPSVFACAATDCGVVTTLASTTATVCNTGTMPPAGQGTLTVIPLPPCPLPPTPPVPQPETQY